MPFNPQYLAYTITYLAHDILSKLFLRHLDFYLIDLWCLIVNNDIHRTYCLVALRTFLFPSKLFLNITERSSSLVCWDLRVLSPIPHHDVSLREDSFGHLVSNMDISHTEFMTQGMTNSGLIFDILNCWLIVIWMILYRLLPPELNGDLHVFCISWCLSS